MAAIYSNGGNRWNILGFNFTKRDALSSVYKISMVLIDLEPLDRTVVFQSQHTDALRSFVQFSHLGIWFKRWLGNWISTPSPSGSQMTHGGERP
jgi:hypothetical protein